MNEELAEISSWSAVNKLLSYSLVTNGLVQLLYERYIVLDEKVLSETKNVKTLCEGFDRNSTEIRNLIFILRKCSNYVSTMTCTFYNVTKKNACLFDS